MLAGLGGLADLLYFKTMKKGILNFSTFLSQIFIVILAKVNAF